MSVLRGGRSDRFENPRQTKGSGIPGTFQIQFARVLNTRHPGTTRYKPTSSWPCPEPSCGHQLSHLFQPLPEHASQTNGIGNSSNIICPSHIADSSETKHEAVAESSQPSACIHALASSNASRSQIIHPRGIIEEEEQEEDWRDELHAKESHSQDRQRITGWGRNQRHEELSAHIPPLRAGTIRASADWESKMAKARTAAHGLDLFQWGRRFEGLSPLRAHMSAAGW